MISILIVDDSKTSRMMLRHWLQGLHPEAQIVEAESGEEGLLRVEGNAGAFSLVIVDYNMVGMNGLDFIQQVMDRIDPKRILLCTANVQDIIRERAANMGVTFLAKPITPVKIKQFLSEISL